MLHLELGKRGNLPSASEWESANAATAASSEPPLLPPASRPISDGELRGNKPKPELIKQSAPQIGLNAQIFPMEI